MTYFKINGKDFSKYVSALSIHSKAKYNAQTNAAGNTVVDHITTKREISVDIIPLDEKAMNEIQRELFGFSMMLSFRNPVTGALEENVPCILPEEDVEYYTIRADKVQFKTMSIKFSEL